VTVTGDLLLWNARLLDGRGGPPRERVAIEIRAGVVVGGLSAAEAIGAATTGSAQALGLADRGTIEAGKVADLLVVDGDPLEEPGLLCNAGRISLVVRRGVPVGERAGIAADSSD